MKKIDLFSGPLMCLALAFVLATPLASCDNKPDNDPLPPVVAPEIPDPEPDDEPGQRYVTYVKVDGAGSGDGTSWDDAMSAADLQAALIAARFSAKDTVCMAAGTYKISTHNDEFRITGSMTIMGGFAADIAGNGVEMEYPSQHRTIISGDRNDDGTPNSGDVRALSVRVAGTTATLIGLDITGGYITEYGGAGFSVEDGAVAKMLYCRVYGNFSENGSSQGGGGVCSKNASTLYCYKTEITDNKAISRGGGVLVWNGILYMESCLVKGNTITGDFGSGLHSSGDNTIYVANSTVTGNHANSGGAVNMSVGASPIVYISTTIAGNSMTSTTNQEGIEIRCENPYVKIINCVVANDSALRTVNIQGTGAIETGGNNVLGSHNITLAASDIPGKSYTDVFGINALADNGGYPQTIMPAAAFTGASIPTLTSYFVTNAPSAAYQFDLSVDQRGVSRESAATTPGACEGNDASNSFGSVTVDPVEDIGLAW